jgi:hypothetical protein
MNASMTKPSPSHLHVWQPSREEVEAIVAEMRPVIDALATRERQRLTALTAELRPRRLALARR